MSPPGSVVGSVRVAFLIGELMVDAMGGYPEDGPALKGEATADADEVLDQLGGLEAAVREETVIRHADTNIDGKEVHDEESSKIGPGEEEERSDGADVKESHGNACDPVDATLLVSTAHAEILLDLLLYFDGGWEQVELLLGL